MKKIKENGKRPYVIPLIQMVTAYNEYSILAGSPPVQPGHGGSGNTSIESPIVDEEHTDLSGAKYFIDSDLWKED